MVGTKVGTVGTALLRCKSPHKTEIQPSKQPRSTQFTIAPPQHFLYFFPEPHGHGSFRPTLGALR